MLLDLVAVATIRCMEIVVERSGIEVQDRDESNDADAKRLD